jgi:hypothetical protein
LGKHPTKEWWRFLTLTGNVPKEGERVLMGAFPGGPPAYFAHMQKCRDDGTALDNFNLA